MYLAPEAGNILVHRKQVRKDILGLAKVFLDPKARPFAELEASDLVDTRDVCRLFPCARRTVYRWMAEEALHPYCKVGREFFFTKREVMRWLNERPAVGRPLERR